MQHWEWGEALRHLSGAEGEGDRVAGGDLYGSGSDGHGSKVMKTAALLDWITADLITIPSTPRGTQKRVPLPICCCNLAPDLPVISYLTFRSLRICHFWL